MKISYIVLSYSTACFFNFSIYTSNVENTKGPVKYSVDLTKILCLSNKFD